MLLIAIFIGTFIGIAAGVLVSGNNDLLFIDALFGLAGSVAGYALISIMSELDSEQFINGPALLGAIIGSILFVITFNGLHQLFEKHSSSELPPPDRDS